MKTIITDDREFVTINARDFLGIFLVNGSLIEGDSFLRNEIIQFLEKGNGVILNLNGILGYSISSLEKVFGSSIHWGFTKSFLDQNLVLKSDDEFLVQNIQSFIKMNWENAIK